MNPLNGLENRVSQIEYRNKKVELDKSWGKSKTRRILLSFFTFVAISLYLRVINVDNPWLNAIVRTIGFMLSTLTLPFFNKTLGALQQEVVGT